MSSILSRILRRDNKLMILAKSDFSCQAVASSGCAGFFSVFAPNMGLHYHGTVIFISFGFINDGCMRKKKYYI